MLYFAVGSLLFGANQTDAEALQGKWEIVRTEFEPTGRPVTDSFYRDLVSQIVVIKEDRWGIVGSQKEMPGRFTIVSTKLPKQIDLKGASIWQCIYQLKGDELTVCLPVDSKSRRPNKFDLKDKDSLLIVKLKRKK